MVLNEQIDFFSELPGAPKRSPANRLSGDDPEPRFDLIEPGRVGRGEMDMISGFPCKPGTNLLVLMGRIVVHDNMHVQLRRYIHVNVPEKLQQFLMTMSFFRLRKNTPSGNVQSSKNRQRSMADIIMGLAFSVNKTKRKGWLKALKGLALAFLVHTEHQGLFRRIQIQPNDITDLLHEEWIS